MKQKHIYRLIFFFVMALLLAVLQERSILILFPAHSPTRILLKTARPLLSL